MSPSRSASWPGRAGSSGLTTCPRPGPGRSCVGCCATSRKVMSPAMSLLCVTHPSWPSYKSRAHQALAKADPGLRNGRRAAVRRPFDKPTRVRAPPHLRQAPMQPPTHTGHGILAIDLNSPGSYVHWSIFTISVAKLVLIAVMVVIFGAALLLPFPARNRVLPPAPDVPAAAGAGAA